MLKEKLSTLYHEELINSKDLFFKFAEQHPGVANNLHSYKNHIEDPLLQQLIDAFSFMAARVRLQLEDGYSDIYQDILNTVYPHLTRVIPSMTVMELASNQQQNVAELIPKNFFAECNTDDGISCTYRSCYDTEVLPLKIVDLHYQEAPFVSYPSETVTGAKARLSLHINTNDPSFVISKMPSNKLRLYLNLNVSNAGILYELLMNHSIAYAISSTTTYANVYANKDFSVRSLGLQAEEMLLPTPKQTFWAYSLFTEFFVFPEKFMFVDLMMDDIDLVEESNQFIVHIYFDKSYEILKKLVQKNTIKLNCTPFVNLFYCKSKNITPTAVDTEYHVLEESKSVDTYEVYSIDAVTISNQSKDTAVNPLFSFQYPINDFDAPQWFYRKKPAWEVFSSDVAGVEHFIGFKNVPPSTNKNHYVTLKLLCTNRALPEKLSKNTTKIDSSHTENSVFNGEVNIVSRISSPVYPDLNEDQKWRLLSHVSVNSSSLCGDAGGSRLKQLLEVYYPFQKIKPLALCEYIEKIESSRVNQNYPMNKKWGFCSGVKISIYFNKLAKEIPCLYLFGQILAKFFRHYISINSAMKLSFYDADEQEIFSWDQEPGEKCLL